MSGDSPSPNASNGGRGPGGRFAKGDPGGPGNPNARRVALLRSALLVSVTPEAVQQVAAALLAQAKAGDAGFRATGECHLCAGEERRVSPDLRCRACGRAVVVVELMDVLNKGPRPGETLVTGGGA
jgi:hypothetical protein